MGKQASDSRAKTLNVKLKMARLGVGFSTRAVASQLSPQFAISHATIANYEKGRTTPSLEILMALAEIYQRPVQWFVESGPVLTGIRYRNLRSKVRVSDRHWFEANALRWLEAYIKLERRLNRPLRPEPKMACIKPAPEESGASLAQRVRDLLGVGDDPIPSIVDVLDKFGIRTIELPTDLRIDAMAARLGNEPVIVLNPTTSNDRCRINAGHELGHTAFGDCERVSGSKKDEHRSYDFASHLLLPDSQLKAAFEGQSMVRLVQYKERFGISLAAMIYRAEHAGIIRSKVAKLLWVQFAKRGWRTQEPGRVRPDRAIRFEILFDSALAENRLSWREAVSVMGIREEELRERLAFARGECGSAEKKGGKNLEGHVIRFPA